jgi:hypothetical protein
MSGNTLLWIEIVGFHGVVLAWCAWELWSLHRDKKRTEAAASAQRARHAEGEDGAHER